MLAAWKLAVVAIDSKRCGQRDHVDFNGRCLRLNFQFSVRQTPSQCGHVNLTNTTTVTWLGDVATKIDRYDRQKSSTVCEISSIAS